MISDGAPLRTHPRHFHTFDALRFFAFLKVFLFHIPVSVGIFAYLTAGGTLGVRFFFVLSGFLITYLLLVEKEGSGRIDFTNFMRRRILRIWPLYYLIVTFAFLTPWILAYLKLEHSDEGYTPNFFYTVAFLENYVVILKRQPPNVSPLGVIWSICVEEHFYLVWGLILCYLPTRHVPKLIGGGILLAIASRCLFVAFDYATLDLLTNLDLFAFGALPAYLLVAQPVHFETRVDAIPRRLKHLYLVVVVGAVLIYPHLRGSVHAVLGPTILGVLFGGLLSMFLSRNSTFGLSDSNVFSRLGKYTYGLYLYHVIIINLLVVLLRRAHWSWELPQGFLFMLLALGISIAVSAVSYRYFERPFLALKRYA